MMQTLNSILKYWLSTRLVSTLECVLFIGIKGVQKANNANICHFPPSLCLLSYLLLLDFKQQKSNANVLLMSSLAECIFASTRNSILVFIIVSTQIWQKHRVNHQQKRAFVFSFVRDHLFCTTRMTAAAHLFLTLSVSGRTYVRTRANTFVNVFLSGS